MIKNHSTPHRCLQPRPMLLIWLTLSCLAGMMIIQAAHAASALQSLRPPPPNDHELFGSNAQTMEDLRVKVQGGYITVQRTWYAGKWYHNMRWNRLIFKDKLILRNGYAYSQSKTDPKLYEYNIFGEYKIIRKTVDGYRWTNKDGTYLDYDATGKIKAFGDLNGVIGSIVFDANDQITGVFDRNAKQILWYEYDLITHLVTGIRDYTDRKVQYAYVNNVLDNVTLPDTAVWKYTYTGIVAYSAQNTALKYYGDYLPKAAMSYAKLQQITDPETRLKKFTYAPNGAVSSELDGDNIGYRLVSSFSKTSVYDSGGQFMQTKTHTSGYKTTMGYNRSGDVIFKEINGIELYNITRSGNGRKRVKTDHNGNVTIREYDNYYNLIKTTHADKTFITTDYDLRFSKPSKITDERGVVTTHAYDSKGNLLKTIEAAGLPEERTTEYTYDLNGNLLTRTRLADANTAAATTTYADYDAYGNPQTITDAENNPHKYTYDVMGNILTHTDARTNVWVNTYDGVGRILTASDPLLHVDIITYDKVGNIKTATDPRKNTTTYFYDNRNNRIRKIDPYGSVTGYEYDTMNRLVSVTDAEKHSRTLSYDQHGRMTKMVDGTGNVTASNFLDEGAIDNGDFYDANAITYPTYKKIFKYDRRNRRVLTKWEYDAVTSIETQQYDAANNLIAQIDQNNNKTEYGYDGLNHQVKTTRPDTVSISNAYDDRNNLIALTDGRGKIYRYEFDRNNKTSKEIFPSGKTTSYYYDANGSLDYKIDAAGQKIDYGYDIANRLNEVKYYAATDLLNPIQTVNLGYDDANNLTSWGDGSISATISYDNNNRQLSQTVNYGTFSLSYSYTYYKNGQKKTFTGPDGSTYTYTYNANNQFTSLQIPGQGAIAVNEYRWQAPSKISLPGGGRREQSFNGLQNPTTIIDKDPAKNTLSKLDYVYGPAQNIKERTTLKGKQTYGYDDLYQLTAANDSSYIDQTYTYDKAGNRLNLNGSAPWSYNDDNGLLTQNTLSYKYDANGNRASRYIGTTLEQVYRYDIENRLVQVEDGLGAVIAQYGYDPMNRRIWKEISGIRTYYLYSREGLVGEYDTTGAQQVAYGYRPDSMWGTNPQFIKTSTGYAYYHNDILGTPRKLSKSNGAVVWSAEYDAFGKAAVDTGFTIVNNLRFAGQYYDSETGLHYNNFRYYDPSIGKYINSDVIGLSGGINTYAYVNGNPIRYVDPLGLQPVCFNGRKTPKTTKKTETNDIHLYSYFIVYALPMGIKVDQSLDPSEPRKIPLGIDIHIQVWSAERRYWVERTLLTETTITRWRRYCNEERKDKCGQPYTDRWDYEDYDEKVRKTILHERFYVDWRLKRIL